MKYKRGQTVKVMHAPGDPQSARLPGWFRMWFGPVFSGIFALAFLGAGLAMFFAGDGAQQQRVSASAVSEPAEGTVTMPGALPTDVVPSVPGSGGSSGFIVSDGSGAPRTVQVDCVSLRGKKGGNVREVHLRFEGGELTLTASPYTGPGPYTPGTNLDVGGTLFGAQGQLTGAVVFDASGKAGSVNLIAGSASATGTWGCT